MVRRLPTTPPEVGASPTSLKSHPSYYLRRRTTPRPSNDGFKGVWYDVVRKKRVVRRDRAGWGKPLSLIPVWHESRRDLEVELFSGRRRKHTWYHRLVGLALLKCHWDGAGNLLKNPRLVPVEKWGCDWRQRYWYEVHHLDGPSVVDPRRLAVLPRRLHVKVTKQGFDLPTPRDGWGQ